MALKTLNAKNAAALDKDLMSAVGAFSIDQLMELAGLSVSQAVYRLHPPSKGRRILVACGPGNNGGDGLVAARHLWHYGYKPTVYYPKRSKNELYQRIKLSHSNEDGFCVFQVGTHGADQKQRLTIQLQNLKVPFADDFNGALENTDHVVDAIFGFSFSGEIREPFPSVIEALEKTDKPVTSVDAPSSWNIEEGPPTSGPGKNFNPAALVSLTAPKPLVKFFKGRHFVGGRFVSPDIAEKYNLWLPEYSGVDQVVEVDVEGSKI